MTDPSGDGSTNPEFRSRLERAIGANYHQETGDMIQVTLNLLGNLEAGR